MKTLFASLFLLLATAGVFSCHKKKTSADEEVTPVENSARRHAELLRGNWVWDSTVYFTDKGHRRLCTYTTGKIVIDTIVPAVVECTTVCNFTMSFSAAPFQGKGDGSGFATYSEFNTNADAHRAAMVLNSVVNQDSLMARTTPGYWVVFTHSNVQNLSLRVDDMSWYRRCTSNLPYFAFFAGNYYTLDLLDTQQLVLKAPDAPGFAPCKCYFHRS